MCVCVHVSVTCLQEWFLHDYLIFPLGAAIALVKPRIAAKLMHSDWEGSQGILADWSLKGYTQQEPKSPLPEWRSSSWRWCRVWAMRCLSKNCSSGPAPSLPGGGAQMPGAFLVTYKILAMKESQSKDTHPLINFPSWAWQHTLSFQILLLGLETEFLLRDFTQRSQRGVEKV